MGSSEGIRATAQVYRNLLKAVRLHMGKEEHTTHFTELIKLEFRNSIIWQQSMDPSFIREKMRLANDYTFLLNSVHHQKDLLFSYNIAVDRSDEVKKILGKSAASVMFYMLYGVFGRA